MARVSRGVLRPRLGGRARGGKRGAPPLRVRGAQVDLENRAGEAGAFRAWLMAHAADLQDLAFGNHRKFEAKKPELLWPVIESFVRLAVRMAVRRGLLDVTDQARTKEERFDILVRRFEALERFGRTGAFDFAELLAELALIDAAPGSCYLTGSSGRSRGRGCCGRARPSPSWSVWPSSSPVRSEFRRA